MVEDYGKVTRSFSSYFSIIFFRLTRTLVVGVWYCCYNDVWLQSFRYHLRRKRNNYLRWYVYCFVFMMHCRFMGNYPIIVWILLLISLSLQVSIPAWFTVDTRLGSLSVHLDTPQCFSAEMYSADLQIAGKPEDDKVNIYLVDHGCRQYTDNNKHTCF